MYSLSQEPQTESKKTAAHNGARHPFSGRTYERSAIPRFGLGLSGGGYRAACYHLGTLRAFNRIRIRDNRDPVKKQPIKSMLTVVDNLSTVSGGSIIGAYLVCNFRAFRNNFEQQKERFFRKCLNKNCEIASIVRTKLVIFALLMGALAIGFNVGFLFAKSFLKPAQYVYPEFASAFFSGFAILPAAGILMLYGGFLDFARYHWLKIQEGQGFFRNPDRRFKITHAPLLVHTDERVLLVSLLYLSILAVSYSLVFTLFNLLGLVMGFLAFGAAFLIRIFFNPGFSKGKSKFLQKNLFRKKILGRLPDRPQIAINATVMESSESWIFSKRYMGGEDRYQASGRVEFDPYDFLVADAVSASSNFPPVFEPLRIARSFYLPQMPYPGHTVTLTDGGCIDNHGVYRLTKLPENPGSVEDFFSDFVLISDSDPPQDYRKSRRGVINQVSNLIQRVLLIKVAEYNRYRSQNVKIDPEDPLPPPVYVSLSDDIDKIILDRWLPDPAFAHAARMRFTELQNRMQLPPGFDIDRFMMEGRDGIAVRDPGYEAFKRELFRAIGFDPDHYAADNERRIQDAIKRIGTRLTPIRGEMSDYLIRHSEMLTDFLVKFWFLDRTGEYEAEGEDVFQFRASLIEHAMKRKWDYWEERERAKNMAINGIRGKNNQETAKNSQDLIEGDPNIHPDFKGIAS